MSEQDELEAYNEELALQAHHEGSSNLWPDVYAHYQCVKCGREHINYRDCTNVLEVVCEQCLKEQSK